MYNFAFNEQKGKMAPLLFIKMSKGYVFGHLVYYGNILIAGDLGIFGISCKIFIQFFYNF